MVSYEILYSKHWLLPVRRTTRHLKAFISRIGGIVTA